MIGAMQIVASDEARRMIVDRGGRLYVGIRTERCCKGARPVRTLVASTDPGGASDWQDAGRGEGFEVFLPREIRQLPEELHLEARRFPRRVEAYWNGCPWIP